jgi:hypothetical protein
MAVRTRLPWWGRVVSVALLCALVGGMWWWGFDFGRIFGGSPQASRTVTSPL